jgi:hypothetical protein
MAMTLYVGTAAAQAPPVLTAPAGARKEAARKYTEGTRAFDAGDFTGAAQAFEAAYALAPHPDALWNAARAWHRAGELARAANLYARYLREVPWNAPDRATAQAAMKTLASKLARIEVRASPGVEAIRLDDSLLDATVVYVIPGVHVLRGHTATGDVEERTTVKAGAEVSVLVAPAESPAPAAPDTPASPSASPMEPAAPAPPPHSTITPEKSGPAPRSGWSPVVFAVETGLTVAVTGITIWSGVDTLSTRQSFLANPTQGTLDSGRFDQLRTNVLLGVSIGLAALTAATAIFLVDWGGPRAEATALRVGLGPASAFVRGSF